MSCATLELILGGRLALDVRLRPIRCPFLGEVLFWFLRIILTATHPSIQAFGGWRIYTNCNRVELNLFFNSWVFQIPGFRAGRQCFAQTHIRRQKSQYRTAQSIERNAFVSGSVVSGAWLSVRSRMSFFFIKFNSYLTFRQKYMFDNLVFNQSNFSS